MKNPIVTKTMKTKEVLHERPRCLYQRAAIAFSIAMARAAVPIVAELARSVVNLLTLLSVPAAT